MNDYLYFVGLYSGQICIDEPFYSFEDAEHWAKKRQISSDLASFEKVKYCVLRYKIDDYMEIGK